MTDKDWYDKLTEQYEFTVVLQPHAGQPNPIAAKYLIGEATRDEAYLTDESERLQVEGWRPLTSTVEEGTRAIMLVRDRLWVGIEDYVLTHFPDTQQITTPFRDPQWSDADYQTFLASLDYEPVAKAAWGKHIQ